MLKIPLTEIQFSFARSSGAGGQNVNKVETKAAASWNFEDSACLSERQKYILRSKQEFLNRLDKDGNLVIRDQTSRSQSQNRENCVSRLQQIVERYLKVKAKRVKTKVPKRAVEKRLKDKKDRAGKLRTRRIELD